MELKPYEFDKYIAFAALIRAEAVSLQQVANFAARNPLWPAWWEADKRREHRERADFLNGMSYRRSGRSGTL